MPLINKIPYKYALVEIRKSISALGRRQKYSFLVIVRYSAPPLVFIFPRGRGGRTYFAPFGCDTAPNEYRSACLKFGMCP